MTTVRRLFAPGGILFAHLLPFTLFVSGIRARDWVALAVFYVLMGFALGGGLHRYFAHRSFRTHRVFQFLLALLASCFFGDAIGFAAKHRLHHRYSDTDKDVHSPNQGWWRCWIGNLFEDVFAEEMMLGTVSDLSAYPELMWLHRNFYYPGFATAALVLAFGGFSMLAFSYCFSFLLAVHGPSAVNYFCHLGRNRRFETRDRSTNNAVLGILFFGEGWHNNHHYYPGSARSGFAWWEIDVIYYMLKALQWTGLVWDVREVPRSILNMESSQAA